MFRLYWLGPATVNGVELGPWAIDTGAGSDVWRVHEWNSTAYLESRLSTDPAVTRPRGWISFSSDSGVYADGFIVTTQIYRRLSKPLA